MIKELNILIENLKKFRLFPINEAVDKTPIIKAVKDREVLYIYYAGDKTIHRGWRTVEPFAVGVSTAGNPVLRAWQQHGVSDSYEGLRGKPTEKPGWRLFRLDGITSIINTSKMFRGLKPNYNPNDSQMVTIYAAVANNDVDSGMDGMDSIEEPNTANIDKSAFSTQTNKLKSFYNADEDNTNFHDFVVSRYNILKHSHKKSPKNYFVGKKGQSYFVGEIKDKAKYGDFQELGNFQELFQKETQQSSDIEKRSFFDKQKRKFRSKINQ
jgi:hypothetical protein